MSSRVMHQMGYQRLAVSLALMAMIMMFAGPLISQARLAVSEGHQEYRPGEMVHSGMSHSGMSHSGMSHSGILSGAMPDERHQASVFQWFDQCGYCSLWQHFPATQPDLFPLLRDHAKPLPVAVALTLRGITRAPVFPNALSRAPPVLS